MGLNWVCCWLQCDKPVMPEDWNAIWQQCYQSGDQYEEEEPRHPDCIWFSHAVAPVCKRTITLPIFPVSSHFIKQIKKLTSFIKRIRAFQYHRFVKYFMGTTHTISGEIKQTFQQYKIYWQETFYSKEIIDQTLSLGTQASQIQLINVSLQKVVFHIHVHHSLLIQLY